MPRIALLIGISVLILSVQPASTDDFVMKDGSVIEGIIKNYDARSKEILVQIDEKGKTRRIKERDIKYRVKRKTSWERRAIALKWYEKNEPRRKDTWKDREFFGNLCRRKGIPDKAEGQFELAYKYRSKEFEEDLEKEKDPVREILKFAKWCEKIGQLDERQKWFGRAYKIKREDALASADARAKDDDDKNKRRSKAHYDLGQWCASVELEDEAMAEYEKSLELNPDNSSAVNAVNKIKESIAYRFKKLAEAYKADGRAWDLSVTIEDAVSAEVMQEWKEKMQRLSTYIFEITEGQCYIAHVKLEDDTTGGKIIVEKGKMNQAGMQGNSGVLAYCKASGSPMWEVHCPGKAATSVLCHEIFHGVFGLRDEYYQNPQCPCVMRSAPNPQKLCTPETHIGGGRAANPCWDEIKKRRNVKNFKHPNPQWTAFSSNKRKMPREMTGGAWDKGGELKIGTLKMDAPPDTKFTIIDN